MHASVLLTGAFTAGGSKCASALMVGGEPGRLAEFEQ